LGFVPASNQNLTFRLASGIYYQSPFYKEFRKITTDENANRTILLNEDIKSQRSIHFVAANDLHFRMMDNRPFKFTTEL
jgi:hypothetical protein